MAALATVPKDKVESKDGLFKFCVPVDALIIGDLIYSPTDAKCASEIINIRSGQGSVMPIMIQSFG